MKLLTLALLCVMSTNYSYKVLQLSIYVATISATFLASIGHPEWMPALIALGAGFKAVNEYHQLEQILPITNAAIKVRKSHVCKRL